MADVLVVAAVEFGDPVVLLVAMKARDLLFHSFARRDAVNQPSALQSNR